MTGRPADMYSNSLCERMCICMWLGSGRTSSSPARVRENASAVSRPCSCIVRRTPRSPGPRVPGPSSSTRRHPGRAAAISRPPSVNLPAISSVTPASSAASTISTIPRAGVIAPMKHTARSRSDHGRCVAGGSERMG